MPQDITAFESADSTPADKVCARIRIALHESSVCPGCAYPMDTMTAKEKLRQAVELLTEEEAEEALRLLDQRGRDPMLEAAERAPLDDEPTSTEEDQSTVDAWAEYERGQAVPLSEIHDEID